MHSKEMQKADDSFERIAAVAAWRDTPFFTDAERAALALTEAGTRIADKGDPVPDHVWDEAAKHYDERSRRAGHRDRDDQRVEPVEPDDPANRRQREVVSYFAARRRFAGAAARYARPRGEIS